MSASLVGSEMCIRDRSSSCSRGSRESAPPATPWTSAAWALPPIRRCACAAFPTRRAPGTSRSSWRAS
eukprot:14441701-Alexandrium_andersonii.AAC.1